MKACRKCGYITDDASTQCPNCGYNDFTTTFKGMLYVVDPDKSILAQKRGYKVKGYYAVIFE